MQLTLRSFLAAACGAGLLAGSSFAQANVIAGTDVALGVLGNLSQVAHTGSFPGGMTAMAMSTTSCNFGTTQVPWLSTDDAPPGQPMLDDHPLISFLIARESDGHFQQISDYSFLKHGFFALASSQCTPCQGGSPGGDFLGLGCSDTYGVGNNGDNYWLAPASEIDPWLGTWDPFGSYFDVNGDGIRSFFGGGVGTLGNRVKVSDADLSVPGAEYFYQGYYVIRGEPEFNRANNFRTRQFTPNWNGSSWNFSEGGANLNTTVLAQWDGATITSEANGGSDGRVYVAAKVTGPEQGLYHYEYAVHNRDAMRGVATFRLPTCVGAQVLNAGMSDIDGDAGNDWTFLQNAGEITFTTTDNPIRWNSFYSFWFDSDAAPLDKTVTYNPFDAGPGLNAIGVKNTPSPAALYNVQVGPGCGTVPNLYLTGAPPQATLGNATLTVELDAGEPGVLAGAVVGFIAGSQDLGNGCVIHMGGSTGNGIFPLGTDLTDATGGVSFPIAIPNNASLEGLNLYLQGYSMPSGGGSVVGFDVTNGVQVRVGDMVTDCP